jgi:hypothetical protein
MGWLSGLRSAKSACLLAILRTMRRGGEGFDVRPNYELSIVATGNCWYYCFVTARELFGRNGAGMGGFYASSRL